MNKAQQIEAALRNNPEISQRDLARRLGVSESYVSAVRKSMTQQPKTCLVCGKRLSDRNRYHLCQQHGHYPGICPCAQCKAMRLKLVVPHGKRTTSVPQFGTYSSNIGDTPSAPVSVAQEPWL